MSAIQPIVCMRARCIKNRLIRIQRVAAISARGLQQIRLFVNAAAGSI
jgi:hypothetical protein